MFAHSTKLATSSAAVILVLRFQQISTAVATKTSQKIGGKHSQHCLPCCRARRAVSGPRGGRRCQVPTRMTLAPIHSECITLISLTYPITGFNHYSQ